MHIQGHFSGKRILMTGVTGFLGKTILEKLLWDVPDIEKIILLVRPAEGSAPARIRARSRVYESIRVSPAFERLRGRHEDITSFLDRKTEVIPCDLMEEGLGITAEDMSRIQSGLDTVIHVAARVSWNERFDHAVRVNALASRQLLSCAAAISPPPQFVYISSAYVHGQRTGRVFEVPFDPSRSIANEQGSTEPFDLDAEISSALAHADEVESRSFEKSVTTDLEKQARLQADLEHTEAPDLSDLMERLRQKRVHQTLSQYGMSRARRHGWIDSYTFSKAVAEMLLGRHRGSVPLIIIRPPGITSALADPVAGWLEGYHLVEPLIEGVGKGLISAFPGLPEAVIDTVPVDYVVNLILAACAGTDARDTQAIYQIGTSHLNAITLGEIEQIWRTYFREHPMTDDKGRPIRIRPIRFHRHPERFARKLYLQYQLPLSLAEKALTPLLFANGVRPYRRLMRWVVKSRKRIERVRSFSDLYSAYTMNSWIFMNETSRELFDKLDSEDQTRFGFDVQKLDWQTFWTQVHIPGMRRFVLEEGHSQ